MNPIRTIFQPVTEHEVAAFEAALGVGLPADYRKFLLEFNGGVPEKDSFTFDGENCYADSSVRSFFGLAPKQDDDLNYYLEIYVNAKRIHADMLPIAQDYGGNIVVMAVKGPKSGQILFWNHELEGIEPDASLREHLNPIALSFSDFVNCLLPE